MLGRMREGERIVVMGLPGSGKTTHAEWLTAESPRAIWFTPTMDFRKPGRLLCTVEQLEAFPFYLKDPHARIVIDLEDVDTDAELAAALRRVVRMIRKTGGNLVLVCDEVGDYKRAADGVLLSLFRRCRHDRIAVILASQITTDIPRPCRKIASRAVCFGQQHPGELWELEDIYGEEFATRAKAWRPYEEPAIWRSPWEH